MAKPISGRTCWLGRRLKLAVLSKFDRRSNQVAPNCAPNVWSALDLSRKIHELNLQGAAESTTRFQAKHPLLIGKSIQCQRRFQKGCNHSMIYVYIDICFLCLHLYFCTEKKLWVALDNHQVRDRRTIRVSATKLLALKMAMDLSGQSVPMKSECLESTIPPRKKALNWQLHLQTLFVSINVVQLLMLFGPIWPNMYLLLVYNNLAGSNIHTKRFWVTRRCQNTSPSRNGTCCRLEKFFEFGSHRLNLIPSGHVFSDSFGGYERPKYCCWPL